MRQILLLQLMLLITFDAWAQLKVNSDKTHLVTQQGKTFFWLGDTAWELFHRLDRDEAKLYLKNRADKGFTVIQAVVLAELDGLNTPNPYGQLPLIDNDPTKPNEKYFEHVDFIVNEANRLGLMIGMLPSWGDKWNKAWGKGPEIFDSVNAGVYGRWLGNRYKNKPIIWIMGGDRDCVEPADYALIRAMVRGIKSAVGDNHLFTFHPQGGKSSSDFFKNDEWVDFHMSQTGHSEAAPNYKFNAKHREMTPRRPHLDGEPRYEDHPNAFNPTEKGWLDDFDTRQAAYWSMLSGAFGHTYGNHNIWQMFTEKHEPISVARTHWRVALNHPGSLQMGYMKKMFETRPWHRLEPAQELITSENPEGKEYRVAAITKERDLMMVYIPYGRKTSIDITALTGTALKGWWFNPRDGRAVPIKEISKGKNQEFTPPSVGRGSDFVLIIEDASRRFPEPRGD